MQICTMGIGLLLGFFTLNAQQPKLLRIDPRPFADNANHWYGIADKNNMINALPDKPRFEPEDIRQIADNILLFQKNNGGWPKNYDMFARLTDEQKQIVAARKNDQNTTFDNGTCYTQIKALAIAYAALKEEKYKEAAIRGLDYIVNAQYENGGWPQYYPLQNNYSRYITYNDGGMEGIVRALKDITDDDPLYSFVDHSLKNRLKQAFQKGLDCILKTQIKDNGLLTAWGQQYDEKTLEPVGARRFEPAAICNGESAGIVLFLMSLDKPAKEIKDAVQAAVQWFRRSAIANTRIETIRADTMVTPYLVTTADRVVKIDNTAPPIWTRYYELHTQKPLFCNRDGKVVYSLAEVERERRVGYAWYTYAPKTVLDRYAEWQKKWDPGNNVLNE